MLINQTIIIDLLVLEDYTNYSYEFIVNTGTCESLPAPNTVLNSGNLTLSGLVEVSAEITYFAIEDCFVSVSFILYSEETYCNSSIIILDASGMIINPLTHYECMGSVCIQLPGAYDINNSNHYEDFTCNGSCIAQPPTLCSKGSNVAVNLNYNCETNSIDFNFVGATNLVSFYIINVPVCNNEFLIFTEAQGSVYCPNPIFSFVIPVNAIAVFDSSACYIDKVVIIDCNTNPCEGSEIDGFYITDGGYSLNNCNIPVPIIADNFDCKGSEDILSSDIYNNSFCSKNGFFKHKYYKITNGIQNCINTQFIRYAYVPSTPKFIYPTASVNMIPLSSPNIISSYSVNPSYITQNLFNVVNKNFTLPNYSIITNPQGLYSFINFTTLQQIKDEVDKAFNLWAKLLSFIFGVDFQAQNVLYNSTTSVNDEWLADFYISFIYDDSQPSENIFYNNGEWLGSFGTPLNYTNNNISKGGVISLNMESPFIYVTGNPNNNEVCLSAEIFKSIGNALGLRFFYEDTNNDTILSCNEVTPNNSAFNQLNTFMSHDIKGVDINNYIVTTPSNVITSGNVILDAFCIECIQKKYLLS